MIEKPGSPSRARMAVGLIVSVAICFSAAAIGGFATSSSVSSDWFSELNKPSWNPPDWLFGPVWSVLYLMMAIAAWLVWKAANWNQTRLALCWFGFHLVLNVLWSVLFFGMQQIGWAAIEILLLWVSILVTAFWFHRFSKPAAALLVPYLGWVTFASILNITIWSLNRGG